MTEKSADDLRFFGKVTAGVTHDLQNVIAVIKETAGLMEDILLMNRDKELPFLEKFQKSLTTIKNQAIRGSTLIKSLNEFAHAPDNDEKEIDIVATARMLAALIERKSRSSEIQIHVEPSTAPSMIRTHAVRFEMALLMAIESMMGCVPRGGSLMIVPEIKEGETIINIRCKEDSGGAGRSSSGPGELPCESWSALERIVKTINGHAHRPAQEKEIILRFNV